jgi:hypothetical protein
MGAGLKGIEVLLRTNEVFTVQIYLALIHLCNFGISGDYLYEKSIA